MVFSVGRLPASPEQQLALRTDIGLSQVNNTADMDKPVSTAVQTILDTVISGSALSNPSYRNARSFKLNLGSAFGGMVSTSNTADTSRAAANSAVLTAAIAYVKNLAVSTGGQLPPMRAVNKTALFIPAGTYWLDSSVAHVIDFRGFSIEGEASGRTVLLWEGGGVLFDFGAFSTTPSSIFSNQAQTYRLTNLSILKPSGMQSGVAWGARTGQAIRDAGNGDGELSHLTVGGFAYGYNFAYASDFTRLIRCEAQLCDVAGYAGPGSQQFYTENFYAYLCGEGFVQDRVAHITHTQPWFVGCGVSAMTFEQFASTGGSTTSTRQVTSMPSAGTSTAGQTIVTNPWFETNPGNLGNNYISDQFIKISNANVAAIERIVISDAWIGAGDNSTPGSEKFVSAFVKAVTTSGSNALQRIRIERPLFQGKMTKWADGISISRSELIEPRTVDGYTAPALGNITRSVDIWATAGQTTEYRATLAYDDVRQTNDGTDGYRTRYDAIDGQMVLSYSQLISGTWYRRFGIDIANRRIFIGDPASDISLGRAPSVPTSGKYNIGSFVHNTVPVVSAGKVLTGWIRLTTGSAHVVGTDWTPVYGTTT